MFPKWDFDVEDTLAENIIKLMFPAVVSPAKKKVVKEDCPRPRKKARKEAPAEASEEAAAEASEEAAAEATDAMREGFGTCLKEIKYMSERVEAVEKKSETVNGTNPGRKSLAEDKGPDVPAAVPADASSSEDKAPEPSLNLVVSNPLNLPRHIDAWNNVLRKRYDANPQHFRSEIMCFLDHLFAQQWRFNFKDFKDSKPDHNGLGRRLPGGAWNYYAGTIPSFCQSNKVWGTDIDDIYAPVNFADSHWIFMWISIPKRHIVVFDSICYSISPEELDVFSKKDFAKPNGKSMRDKMAVDIFQELPDAHEFENKDNNAKLGAYDG
ncbi:BnaCnng71710D [Brassica napus]|uniref:(rape) hypothetical protein n=1 Tax=Brassica napus TaxID=3708 RepID=A0A078JXK6_BRANA|nr:unnamed protein product [Brassica napus]CDY71175.1 BnaCnng71710D [Brassica napus]